MGKYAVFGRGAMNVLQLITQKVTPWKFEFLREDIQLYELDSEDLTTAISEIVHMPIDHCTLNSRVKRVILFDVTPYKVIDPPLVYCSAVNLKEYYFLWEAIVSGRATNKLYKYEEMMNALDIGNLDKDEAAFMLMNMLKFKNKYVRRG